MGARGLGRVSAYDARVGQSVILSTVSEVTLFLQAIEQGNTQAAADLLPLVYDELRKLAASQMSREAPGHTLNATALVHEAYLRLVGDQQFQNRGHFFAAAAQAMRRILIDNARAKATIKRGGDRLRVELIDHPAALPDDPNFLLSLDDLLTRLAAQDGPAAQIAQLHLFAGLSVEEAGDALGMSRPKAYRNWKYARAWLREALEK